MDNKDDLKNKNVLFFSWPFYDYPHKIEQALVNLGAHVDTFLSAPTDNFLEIRLMEKYEWMRKKYFRKILSGIREKKYDYIFFINAAVFPEYFISELMEKYPKSIKILYSWDSVAVYPGAIKLHKYFDKIYSFDSDDVQTFNYMKFLPLFYCDEMENDKKNSYIYDLSFVGFGHTERYNFISKIRKYADENGLKYYFKLYLPSLIHYVRGKYFKKIFADAQITDFIFKSIPTDEMSKISKQTRIVVDIELKSQSGLTMRTIETHGARKKLITTNNNIKRYDFYNEDNILVVDRENPVIPDEFIKAEYKDLPEYLYKKYSLSTWLKVMFRTENI